MEKIETAVVVPAACRTSRRRRVGRKTAGSAGVAVVLALGLVWWAWGVRFLAGGNDRSFSSESASPVAETTDQSSRDRAPAEKSPPTETSSTPGDSSAAAKSSTNSSAKSNNDLPNAAQDAGYASLIVGDWEQFNKGKRVLTVRGDGTASVKVSMDGAWSYVVGEQLEFEIRWEITGNRLHFQTTGGKPEGSFKIITSMFGKERNHKIEKLSDGQLILVDEKDGSRENWKRLAATKK